MIKKKNILIAVLLTLSFSTSCAVKTKTRKQIDKNLENKKKETFIVKSHPGRNGSLTDREMRMARIAWKYFENNYNPKTGLVNAVNNYPSATMWDLASYLGGLVAAYELNIIDKFEFDKRIVAFVKTFNKMDLFRGELPNKAYNTKTAKKVDYANRPGEIGYSALDIGRLMIWMKIIKERYPEHGDAIDNVFLRWNYCNMINEVGTMFGAAVSKKTKKTIYLQEGRLGYEEYAAKGFQLWGFDTEKASKPEPYEFVPIYDIKIPYDTRDPRKLGAHNYVVCESYVLDGVELNWDKTDDESTDDNFHSDSFTSKYAQKIYDVQEKRFKETGILTARTEHQLDGPPYFVYDTIYTDGYAWNTITEAGTFEPDFSAIALKGALGLWSLWKTDYTNLLFDRISDAYDPEKGFYEGIYENGKGFINTFTSNNNGIILEALLYKLQGKLLKHSNIETLWDKKLKDEFYGQKQCLPHQRKK